MAGAPAAGSSGSRTGATAWSRVAWRRRPQRDTGATLPEQIEGSIAELISDGTLRPGSRLPSERELGQIFGVSRLAVRKATHRLEVRGLVSIRRGAGMFVSASAGAAPEPVEPHLPARLVAAPSFDELADVRMVLELAAADGAACRAVPSRVAVLQQIATRFEEEAASDEPRFDLLAASDTELHLEIARAAGNALLAQLIEEIHDAYRLGLEWSLRRPGRPAEAAVEHRLLVDAIAAGDPGAAHRAMFIHLTRAAASTGKRVEDLTTVD